MVFGKGFFDWVRENAEYLYLAALIIGGLYLAVTKKTVQIIVFVFVMIIAAGFIFDPNYVKDLMFGLFKRFFQK